MRLRALTASSSSPPFPSFSSSPNEKRKGKRDGGRVEIRLKSCFVRERKVRGEALLTSFLPALSCSNYGTLPGKTKEKYIFFFPRTKMKSLSLSLFKKRKQKNTLQKEILAFQSLERTIPVHEKILLDSSPVKKKIPSRTKTLHHTKHTQRNHYHQMNIFHLQSLSNSKSCQNSALFPSLRRP